MAKTDIESAFRLIQVHPNDWELLGMNWNGGFYFEKFLLIGLRGGPFLFNQYATAIHWILEHKCVISYVTHFLDDFLIIEPKNPDSPFDKICKVSLQETGISIAWLELYAIVMACLICAPRWFTKRIYFNAITSLLFISLPQNVPLPQSDGSGPSPNASHYAI